MRFFLTKSLISSLKNSDFSKCTYPKCISWHGRLSPFVQWMLEMGWIGLLLVSWTRTPASALCTLITLSTLPLSLPIYLPPVHAIILVRSFTFISHISHVFCICELHVCVFLPGFLFSFHAFFASLTLATWDIALFCFTPWRGYGIHIPKSF